MLMSGEKKTTLLLDMLHNYDSMKTETICTRMEYIFWSKILKIFIILMYPSKPEKSIMFAILYFLIIKKI